jgi:hypothetical protein
MNVNRMTTDSVAGRVDRFTCSCARTLPFFGACIVQCSCNAAGARSHVAHLR